MELSERYIQKLELAGYRDISEEQLAPGEIWQGQTGDFTTEVLVTDGSLLFEITTTKELVMFGRAYTIPPRTVYAATAGEQGAIYITGIL